MKNMNEHKFDRLIELYQKGLLRGSRRKLVDDWLNTSGTEDDALFSDKDKDALQKRISVRLQRTQNDMGTPGINIRKTPAGIRFSLYNIAASLALLVLAAFLTLGYIRYRSSDDPARLTTTCLGGIKKVILSDGTLVWLKGKSKLTYPSSFPGHTRNVALDGEALFEVAKDPQHPFIVASGNLTTTVLGTSFNIKSVNENIEVVVLTGRVALSSTDKKQGVLVLPNEKVVYDTSERKMGKKQNTPAKERSSAVSGTQYVMAFEDAKMDEVIRRIEEKFEVKIRADHAQFANCMITADFSDQSLESTLNLISQVLGFTYTVNGKTVSLLGKGCN